MSVADVCSHKVHLHWKSQKPTMEMKRNKEKAEVLIFLDANLI